MQSWAKETSPDAQDPVIPKNCAQIAANSNTIWESQREREREIFCNLGTQQQYSFRPKKEYRKTRKIPEQMNNTKTNK